MSGGHEVRVAVPRDFPSIAALQVRCNPLPWGPNLVRSSILAPTTAAVVVGPEGAVSAYLIAERLAEEWHVLDIGVTPEQRRRGLGRAVLTAFLDMADRVRLPVTLEVRASNAPAIGLYLDSGFSTHGRRPRYYSDNGEDAEIMWRPVPEQEDAA